MDQQLSAETLPAQNTEPAPMYKLYTHWQVAAATFLGGPIAGTWLLGANYASLGQPESRKKALLYGSIATVILLILGIFILPRLPEQVSGTAFAAGTCAAMMTIAKSLQESLVKAHVAKGGAKGSGWHVVGIGLLALMITLLLGMVIFVVIGYTLTVFVRT